MSKQENSLNSLLAAEERANKIIKEAEDKREEMRKNAQNQAQQEISQMRKRYEDEFQAKRKEGGADGDAMRSQAQSVISLNEKEYDENKQAVIDMIVQRIMHVRYEMPRNVKADFHSLLAKPDAN
jgi:V-type H+-transporting ATPase subunit G